MKKVLLIIIISLPFIIQAQDCDCESNFKWVKKTFEENDAGFSYVIETKGTQAYDMHNEIFQQKVQSIENAAECYKTLLDWLKFFRSGHIHITPINSGNSKEKNEKPNDEDIIKQFEDWETLDIDLNKFKTFLENKSKVDFEGIWESSPYTIGVKKQGQVYIGFIIEADGVYWRKGQVKFKINVSDSGISFTYYMKNHSAQNFDHAELIEKNIIKTGHIVLKRVFPKYKSNPLIEQHFKIITAEKPYFEQINNTTAYIRIPSFGQTEKNDIDSVILNNKDKILSTENLIIDIRNGTGGADPSYREIIPILYTNPIRMLAAEFLSTKLNNQSILDLAKPELGLPEETREWAKETYLKLEKNIGEFVNIFSSDVNIKKLDTIYPLPKNVGIIINEQNGSTDEQFLLTAKQSKKVKLFGTTTFGVLDISNMYDVKSPCDEFELGYGLTRSMRIPDMAIDDIGIQPDYYIDNDIPEYRWIEFVESIMNAK